MKSLILALLLLPSLTLASTAHTSITLNITVAKGDEARYNAWWNEMIYGTEINTVIKGNVKVITII